jgi:adenine nucleotide transporter 17
MQLKQPVIPDSPKQQSSVRKSSYATTIASLKTILRNEGVGGFYKGLSSKLLQSVLTAAILFAAKDALEGVTRDLLLLLLSYWRRLARTHKHIN